MITISKELSNLGGIARIWLIPSRLISSAHYNFPTTLLQLPMNWDTDAWELTPVFQSASWTQEQQSTTAGTYYENTVAFKLPKSHLRFTLVHQLNNQRVLDGDVNGPKQTVFTHG